MLIFLALGFLLMVVGMIALSISLNDFEKKMGVFVKELTDRYRINVTPPKKSAEDNDSEENEDNSDLMGKK